MSDNSIKIKSVEKLDIGCFPTSVHKLQNLEKMLGYEGIYIKRDDLSGIGPGGNKIRFLEYILADAISQKSDIILVSGPVQSNLTTATASVCRKVGLDCIAVFNGDKPEKPVSNSLLDELLGFKSHYIGCVSEEERSVYVEDLSNVLKSHGRHPYIIKFGGSTGLGAMGYVNCILELMDQCKEKNIQINEIFAPGANGGVAAGLVYGNAIMGFPFKINVISVEYENDLLEKHMHRMISELEKIVGVPFEHKISEACSMIDDYRGDGWGCRTEESVKMVHDFPKIEGIFVENIYTSKVIVGMVDMIKKHKVQGNACYIHTGGFASLFGQF